MYVYGNETEYLQGLVCLKFEAITGIWVSIPTHVKWSYCTSKVLSKVCLFLAPYTNSV